VIFFFGRFKKKINLGSQNFSTKKYCVDFDKKMDLGYILVDFFTNSSFGPELCSGHRSSLRNRRPGSNPVSSKGKNKHTNAFAKRPLLSLMEI
jgi:hypothetical protein